MQNPVIKEPLHHNAFDIEKENKTTGLKKQITKIFVVQC